jgi:hypothetical protein
VLVGVCADVGVLLGGRGVFVGEVKVAVSVGVIVGVGRFVGVWVGGSGVGVASGKGGV